jgi:hypothetical protein
MWVAGVGDSSVGEWAMRLISLIHVFLTFCASPALSCTNPDDTRTGERLIDLHSPTTPREYFRVSMSHPAVERQYIFQDDRLLGALSMTRGTRHLSLHAMDVTNIFCHRSHREFLVQISSIFLHTSILLSSIHSLESFLCCYQNLQQNTAICHRTTHSEVH